MQEIHQAIGREETAHDPQNLVGRRLVHCADRAGDDARPMRCAHSAGDTRWREGDIGTQLGQIAKANPDVAIGSYPFFDPQHGPNTNVVLRARDAHKLAQAKRAVEKVLERVPWAKSS